MTNEQAKQQAIKRAYGESYELCKLFIDQNGWCVIFKDADENFKGIAGNQTHFKESEIEGGQCLHSVHGKGISFKPKSLGDLDSNNGWIRIEPDGSNLPDKKVECWFKDKNQETPICGVFLNDKESIAFVLENATHYQIIETPKIPVY